MKTDVLREKIMKWFLEWAKLKPRIHFGEVTEPEVYFKERQIWWTSIGQNIGSEQNGKHGNFERPVIILKKFNPHTFLAVPVSTKTKEGLYRLVFVNNKERFVANLSQMRVLSSRRLLRLIGNMPQEEHERLRQMYQKMI